MPTASNRGDGGLHQNSRLGERKQKRASTASSTTASVPIIMCTIPIAISVLRENTRRRVGDIARPWHILLGLQEMAIFIHSLGAGALMLVARSRLGQCS